MCYGKCSVLFAACFKFIHLVCLKLMALVLQGHHADVFEVRLTKIESGPRFRCIFHIAKLTLLNLSHFSNYHKKMNFQ